MDNTKEYKINNQKFFDLITKQANQTIKVDSDKKFIFHWSCDRTTTSELNKLFEMIAKGNMEYNGDFILSDDGEITFGLLYELLDRELKSSSDEITTCDIPIDGHDFLLIIFALHSLFSESILYSNDAPIVSDPERLEAFIANFWNSIEPVNVNSD